MIVLSLMIIHKEIVFHKFVASELKMIDLIMIQNDF